MKIVDETDLSGGKKNFVEALGKALVPIATSSRYWKPNAVALSEYIHEAYREDENIDNLRKWLSAAFKEADRLKSEKLH